MTRTQRLLHHLREDLSPAPKHTAKRSLFGLIFLGLLVGLGIWVWPEIRRTVHIHRM